MLPRNLLRHILVLFPSKLSRLTLGGDIFLKKWILWLTVSGLLLLYVTDSYATTQRIKFDYQKNCSEFERVQKNASSSILLKGEIVGINLEEILINPSTVNNEIYHLKLTPSAKFFCNGILSQWEALTPVAPGAYFEAQILVNRQNEVIAVNADYYGEECIIKKCCRNQEKLIFELVSVLSEETFSCQVNQEARLPAGESWRQEGQIVFILFNCRDEIRAVFLPD